MSTDLEDGKGKPASEPAPVDETKQGADALPSASPRAPSKRRALLEAPPEGDYRAKAQSFGRFRLAQDFDRVAGVTKVIVTVKSLPFKSTKSGCTGLFRTQVAEVSHHNHGDVLDALEQTGTTATAFGSSVSSIRFKGSSPDWMSRKATKAPPTR